MVQVLQVIAVVAGTLLLGAPTAALAGPIASTPGFTGGTPRVKTGQPRSGVSTGVRPLFTVVEGIDDPTPHVAVDDGGTAYITWLEGTSGASGVEGGIGFCRVPRGARACNNPPATRVIRPQKASYDQSVGDAPAFNQDAGGGAYPIVIGEQLFILSTRAITTYGENGTGNTTILFASTDAGNTFSGGLPVADKITLLTRPVAFGPDDNPLIGLLGPGGGFGSLSGDDVAFSSVAGGQFNPGGFRLGENSGGVTARTESADGLAPLPNGGIAAVYTKQKNISGSAVDLVVRQFAGPGSPAGTEAFSAPQRFPIAPDAYGLASIAAGPNGPVVGSITEDAGARITPVNGGAPIDITKDSTADLKLTSGGLRPNGPIIASYVEDAISSGLFNNARNGGELSVRRSSDGRTFTAPERLTPRIFGIKKTDTAAAPDGGGFAVFQPEGFTSGSDNVPVRVASFGPQAKSALEGLPGTVPGTGTGTVPGTGTGTVPGAGTDGAITRNCNRIAVGALQVTTDNGVGCFLPGIGANKSKSVSNGPVLYNGIRITPLGGSQIVIKIDKGDKSLRLYSTGDVAVAIPGASGDIDLYRGQLKQQILNAKEGEPFLSLPQYDPTRVKGFKVKNAIAPIAKDGGAIVPIDLDLGDQLLHQTGHLDLVVGARKGGALHALDVGGLKAGLDENTLKVEIDELSLGPVTIRNLKFQWTR
ncbi:MAG: hypothetical protein WKF96_25265, partial [Solirubrobacteraceae bacterium]